jgi:hypothetical protein
MPPDHSAMHAPRPTLMPPGLRRHARAFTSGLVLSGLLALAFPAHAADPATAPASKPAPAKKSPAAKSAAKKPAAPKDLYAVSKPASPADLFANLKHALDHHLLLTDRFYEDATLLRFFGAARTQWYKLPRPFLKNGKLLDMSAVISPEAEPPADGKPAAAKPAAPAVDVLYKLLLKDNLEKRRALIGMDIGRDPRANVDALINAFGRDGRVTNPNDNADPARPRPPTPGNHPLGNKLVSYDFDGLTGKGTINAFINGDGTVGNLILVEEQKEWTLAPIVTQPAAPRPPAD